MIFKVILLFSPLIFAFMGTLTAYYFICVREDKKKKTNERKVE